MSSLGGLTGSDRWAPWPCLAERAAVSSVANNRPRPTVLSSRYCRSNQSKSDLPGLINHSMPETDRNDCDRQLRSRAWRPPERPRLSLESHRMRLRWNRSTVRPTSSQTITNRNLTCFLLLLFLSFLFRLFRLFRLCFIGDKSSILIIRLACWLIVDGRTVPHTLHICAQKVYLFRFALRSSVRRSKPHSSCRSRFLAREICLGSRCALQSDQIVWAG